MYKLAIHLNIHRSNAPVVKKIHQQSNLHSQLGNKEST